jgi:hypothetical protein
MAVVVILSGAKNLAGQGAERSFAPLRMTVVVVRGMSGRSKILAVPMLGISYYL